VRAALQTRGERAALVARSAVQLAGRARPTGAPRRQPQRRSIDPLLKSALPAGVACQTFINAYERKPQPGMLLAARGVGLEYTSNAMICIG
jgi:hypothetical protein